MGIFVALSVPLEHPLNSVSLSYFFEANYGLPPNITYFEPWLVRKRRRRNIDRTAIYRVLEGKFERQVRKQIVRFASTSGYPGRECLLRAICETSEYPIRHNGMIGDIVHVIFTKSVKLREKSTLSLLVNFCCSSITSRNRVFSPSTSRCEGLPQDVAEAELAGRDGSCSEYRLQCPLGLFDLIGVLV
ncbi:hypothetical protein X777_04658 [Ooceraea biroi]|uniref:Uncharacterized protein n=1 Tax=Ooceraea biroi TaxID=2015173 RepID=A0A026X0N3_OOCBI|nr:hypothetical protein X777_04658 [Ooceraea biroi]